MNEIMLMTSGPNGKSSKVMVPTAAAIFRKVLISAPRDFGARVFNIQQWTKMREGGHFAAMV